ncbi:MAG: hypothetical protein NTX46_02570 [Chloroflexi bacterium]|nr:hypothetical protein [Chloroflexota bacterium]
MNRGVRTINKEASSIAYCGLDCAVCINRKGEIADLAKELRKKLREEKFAKMAPGLSTIVDYTVLARSLSRFFE